MAQRRRKRGQRQPKRATKPNPRGTASEVKTSAPGGAEAKTSAPKVADAKTSGTIGGWPAEKPMTRSQRRDAQARAGLTPIKTGERPGAIQVGAAIALLLGIGNLVAFAAGVKISGKHPAAGGIVIFSLLMIACAVGMWRLWYGAVLGFMALLAIVCTIFALLLIEASNVLGLVVALVVIAGSGYLFFKLVRVLSRIQMPKYPGR